MNDKSVPKWITAVAIAAVIVTVVILGVRAVSPPLPPPHVTVVTNQYGAPHPAAGAYGSARTAANDGASRN